jgi:CheY-like chemotaxis protein
MMLKMRALLVEDDATIAEFVGRGLREAGFAVDHEADGETGLAAALRQPYDVAVVDLMLPRRDGLSLIEELRRRKVMTPVLILSARRSVDDRVRGLQAGGDDYLTKPFAFAELLARVQALLRRSTRVAEPTTLTVQDLTLDLLSRRVTRAGQPVRAARVPAAQRRTRRLEDDDPVACLGVQLRSADEHRRRRDQPPARQDRSAVRTQAAAHRAGRRICSPPVALSACGSPAGMPGSSSSARRR